MKKLYYIILTILIAGCDSENASDCFQRTGDIVRQEIEVDSFSKIIVEPNVELVLKQGENISVVVETGDNLLNEVSAVVKNDQLILEDTNDCAFFRDFNQTKFLVTAPNITEIRSATQFAVSSDGVLRYPSIRLLSEDFFENAGNTTGIFKLTIDNDNVFVVGNNIASFFIEGKAKSLDVNFASGTGRFEGSNLIADNVKVFHRGTNKIIVNPQQSIKGEIRSTGDVVCVNRPSVIEVEQFFTGKLVLP